jgi:hypothetical protein
MKLNIQHLLETCIEDGIKDAMQTRKDRGDDLLAEYISETIWIQLDYYFDFETN